MTTNCYYFGVGHVDNGYTGVDGGSNIRIPLMKELMAKGCKVYWCGIEKQAPMKNKYLDAFGLKKEDWYVDVSARVSEPLDIEDSFLLCEMRPNFSKPGYTFEQEHTKLMSYVQSFVKNNRPVFIWDQDCWSEYMPKDYRDKVTLLKPYETQIDGFPKQEKFMFFSQGEQAPKGKKVEKLFDISYCGNVHARKEEFKEFMSPFSKYDRSVLVTGNWLRKKEDDRDFSLDNFPNFLWIGQSEHWSTLPLLKMAKATVNFSNKWQQDNGMITNRVFEAIDAGTPCFVYDRIKNIEQYVPEELIVHDGAELYSKFKHLEENELFGEAHKKLSRALKEHNAAARAEELLQLANE